MKTKFSFFVFTIVALVIAVIGSTACEYIGRADGPDLIIEAVCYSYAPGIADKYGMPISFPGMMLDFTICVRNIGNVAITDSFYISNTSSNEDLERNYYSHMRTVNHDKQRIEPGEALEVTIIDNNIDEDAERVRFMVNPGYEEFPLEERNYRNNSYELELVPVLHHSVTNVFDNTFTISWFSRHAEKCRINYGTSADSLDNTAYDIRGKSTKDYAHYVSVTGLIASNTYYYEIVSGGVTYRNCFVPYEVSTGPTLASDIQDEIIHGTLFWGDYTAAEGAIIYVNISAASQELSVLSDNGGTWSLNIAPTRTADYQGYYAHSDSDNILILASLGGWRDLGSIMSKGYCMPIAEAKAAPLDIILTPGS